MKNVLTVLFLVSTIIMAGCQSSRSASPEEVKKATLGQERRIGMLQSLGGAYTNSQATHLLRMEDGKTLYLKSEGINFNSDKYLGKEVEVMGEILRTTDNTQAMNVKSIDVIDSEATQETDLPQWLDYQSDNLKLNFKYRDDYKVNEEKNAILISKKPDTETPETSVKEADVAANTVREDSLTEMIIEKLEGGKDGLKKAMGVDSLESADVLAGNFNRSKITQKAIEAYKKSGTGGRLIEYFFITDDIPYKISFKAVENDPTLVEEQNMFYDILASIDFYGSSSFSSTDSTESEAGGSSSADKNDEEDKLSGASLSEKKTEESTLVDVQDDMPVVTADSANLATGFDLFSSESQKFSLQYPKSYYFGSVTPSTTDSIKSYQFGTKPLEESSGEISLDIISGAIPEGTTTEYDGVKMISVNNGSNTSVFVESNGKVFRLTSVKSKAGLLKQMAATLE